MTIITAQDFIDRNNLYDVELITGDLDKTYKGRNQVYKTKCIMCDDVVDKRIGSNTWNCRSCKRKLDPVTLKFSSPNEQVIEDSDEEMIEEPKAKPSSKPKQKLTPVNVEYAMDLFNHDSDSEDTPIAKPKINIVKDPGGKSPITIEKVLEEVDTTTTKPKTKITAKNSVNFLTNTGATAVADSEDTPKPKRKSSTVVESSTQTEDKPKRKSTTVDSSTQTEDKPKRKSATVDSSTQTETKDDCTPETKQVTMIQLRAGQVYVCPITKNVYVGIPG